MLSQFHTSFVKSFHQHNYHYVIAVSGGVDSVVASYLFKAAALPFVIAHCNFKLREAESQRDEDFVRQLAYDLNVPFYVEQFDTAHYAKENKLSIQVAARQLRYQWFASLQTKLSLPQKPYYLVTAHHANDAIETSLHHYFRGTGIEGLTGIKAIDKERKIIRPLLPFTKQTILEFAKENNIDFVEDSSNSSLKYKRNFLRNKLIPLLQEEFPAIEQNLINNLQRLQEVEEIYNQSIASTQKKLLVKEAGLHKVAILLLLKQKPLQTIVWEIFKVFSITALQIPEIIKLCTANNSAYLKTETHTILKDRNWLVISPSLPQQECFFIIEKEGSYTIYNSTFSCVKKQAINQEEAKKLPTNKAWLTANSLTFPLIVRSPKVGDYFYPLGMNKKKKLSRFFIDQKLSSQQKQAILVVESNKKIVWVVGYRINERCKVLENTKEVFELSYD